MVSLLHSEEKVGAAVEAASIEYQPIPHVRGLTHRELKERFVDPALPVVIEDFAAAWPASTKWTPAFFAEKFGKVVVPAYTREFANAGERYMGPSSTITMGEYLEQVTLGRHVDLRMFFYRILHRLPELWSDVMFPQEYEGWNPPWTLFFSGCRGSFTPLHYDGDLAHVFHVALFGTKTVLLFGPEMSNRLYRHPLTFRSYVDLEKPDYTKFPKMRGLKGYKVRLQAGETLFMPSGYWHYVYYDEGAYAVTTRFRHPDRRVQRRGKLNLVMTIMDRLLNRIAPNMWFRAKESIAAARD